MNIFLLLLIFVVATVCICFMFSLIGVFLRYILEIMGPGIFTLFVVRFLTMMMEHWMGSTIAWTLSIIAGIWVTYKRIKKLFTDPDSFIKEMRDRDNRINQDQKDFNQWYRKHNQSGSNDDYVKNEVDRCDADKYD